ncbi:IS607 family element RNA-guided endonuclease TnpB [Kitasatospora brasiliensis]|uniref:IS607 family element RNA-guided endonuclease TnpB n=1 Tax=Kitasatospora brasiliensis TaxID=3058040 RepID=UPI002931A761|nr:IS607 family element RNA-guided endonuclease TnpB [Kitasatospora sp. K002]
MNYALLQETLQAFKFALDPTPAQEADLNRHAGAARWAFNWALARKIAAHREWRTRVDALTEGGLSERDARKKASASVRIPGQATIKKHLNQVKGDSRLDGEHPDGFHGPFLPCPWWHEVSTYAFQSAFYDADAAFKNWFDSLTGRRAGRAVGYPRFKKKGRARDSFRLHHDVKKPTIRPDGYRRLIMPRLGSVRIHDSTKRLSRLIAKGQAIVQSVTVSRGGNRWYASVLVKVTRDIPDKPTRAQTEHGTVGVDWGTSHLATLSQPLDPTNPASVHVDNPRHLNAATRQLAKAQRALSRTQRGSNRRTRAARRVGVIQHRIATRRATTIHQLTKQLACRFATVAVEDLNVTGMSASAKGTVEKPGRRVRQKAGLNRAILDASPGELRRQLTYKTSWYGSSLAVADRWLPSSKTCSACGTVKPTLPLAEREYHCTNCGLTIDRDLNAAINIARHAVPLVEGDVKARRSPVSPAREGRHGRAGRQTREGPPPPDGGSPRRE